MAIPLAVVRSCGQAANYSVAVTEYYGRSAHTEYVISWVEGRLDLQEPRPCVGGQALALSIKSLPYHLVFSLLA